MIRVFLLLMFVLGASALADDAIRFNRDVRPILAENCFTCHGQDGNKREADLRLDIAESAQGSGVIVPGDPESSDVIARINSADPDLVMPPPDSKHALTDAQKETLRKWILQGAEFESHWAYIAPKRVTLPDTRHSGWIRNPIDAFVLAKLEAENLSPSPEADRATLIKRLSIDLTGLPPTPAEVDAFVADSHPHAYERLVDRLLESDHYGERMALSWLDAARYADSNGFQQDGDTWQWIWRDWVVRALNDDLPFDQFSIWQLAGDLLPDATVDQKIASGFNRNHLLNGEGGAIAEEQRWVNLFDRIDTTATTWLGLTMTCAQCHNHKYDPITKRDYYSLLDAFNRVPERGAPRRFSTRIRIDTPFLEVPTEENQQRIGEFRERIAAAEPLAAAEREAAYRGWKQGLQADGTPEDIADLPEAAKAILAKSDSDRSEEERKQLEEALRERFGKQASGVIDGLPFVSELAQVRRELDAYEKDQIPRVMIMSDDQARETHILDRGQYLKPLEKVTFATPAFLPALPEDAPQNRLGFARWLFSPEHPLTARVQVNRMWQHFFGVGMVKTPEDFGVQSEYPVHQDLLDWLSVEFRESGWSMKRMHRLIVTSATYRQASKVTAEHRERDAENRLYARSARFRMPSMLLRDWALAASGLLERKIGGVPVYPYQPDNVWEPLAITKERDFTYPTSSGTDLYRRSLYTFWRRTVQPANMFDASNRQACRVRTGRSNTPLHALTTLNDRTWVEAARVLADRSMEQHSGVEAQLRDAFRSVVCRDPDDEELRQLRQAYDRQHAIYAADAEAAAELLSTGEAVCSENHNPTDHAALTVVCLAMLNLDEALTRE